MDFSWPAHRRSSLSNNWNKTCVSMLHHLAGGINGIEWQYSAMRGHLWSGPAQKSESKLADGRYHQVHSHSSPHFICSWCYLWMWRFICLWAQVCGCKLCVAFCSRLICVPTVLCGCFKCMRLSFHQFEDGKTPFESVNVWRGLCGAILRIQIRVSGSFLVQQHTLKTRAFNCLTLTISGWTISLSNKQKKMWLTVYNTLFYLWL